MQAKNQKEHLLFISPGNWYHMLKRGSGAQTQMLTVERLALD